MEKIIIPIPDRDTPGVLDPRVLADTRIQIGVTYPEDNAHIKEEELVKIRSQVGAKNRDLVPGEVLSGWLYVQGKDKKKIRAKTYRKMPGSETEGRQYKPALIYIHGGGFVAGNLEMCENLCRGLAKLADIVVYSIEYRLAPEHRFPVPFDDCYDVLEYVAEHAKELGVDRSRISICGDSAGGNLAAACALRARNEKKRYLHRQILLYPSLNIGKFTIRDYSWSFSCYDCREECQIAKKVIEDVGHFDDLMQNTYVSSTDQLRNPYVCPILEENLEGLPDTVIAVGEFDYLRPENLYYAKRLSEAGTEVTYIQYQGLNHGFAEKLGTYPQAEDLMKRIAEVTV